MTAEGALYHLGFGTADLDDGTTIALLSGDPSRSERIATDHLTGMRVLSRHRGLDAFAATLPGGAPVVCATSGMGAPSMSIVVNELVQVGIRTIIRIGTSGSIQEHVQHRFGGHRLGCADQPGRGARHRPGGVPGRRRPVPRRHARRGRRPPRHRPATSA